MKTSLITKIFLAITSIGCLCFYMEAHKTPPWTGSFAGVRVAIKTDPDPRFPEASLVYADVENFKELFRLEKGDECFALTSPGWKWEDIKDPSFAFVAVFCPRKGAGWADPYLLEKNRF